MPTNINDIKQAFDSIINYPQQGNYTIDMLNILINNAVESLYKQRLGLPEQYEFSTAIPKIAYARTKKIHTDLKPYRKFANVVITDSEFIDGTAFPTDIYYEVAVRYFTTIKVTDTETANKLKNCGCSKIENTDNDAVQSKYVKFVGTLELVEEDKWANRVNSSLIKQAIYLPYYNGWQIHFPITTPSYIRIDYLKRPVKAKWNYTIQNDVEVYNPIGSVDVEFDDMLRSEIVARMVKEYSQYNDDNMDMQFAQNRIQTGE